MIHGNGECAVFSPVFLNNLFCWIWTAFCHAFRWLNSISASFFDLTISYSSADPLPRNSIRQLIVFKDKKCNRGSSLTLKVGHKPVCNEPNFMWRKSEKFVMKDAQWKATLLISRMNFDSPIILVCCKCFKKVRTQNIIGLKVFIHINWKN